MKNILSLLILLGGFFSSHAYATQPTYEEVFPGVKLSKPVWMSEVPGQDDTFWVLQRTGEIYAVQPGKLEKKLIIDLSKLVGSKNEEGLLGLAFHPQFLKNKRVFLYYTEKKPRQTVVAEYQYQADGTISRATEKRIFTQKQPFWNHNGGQISFAADGMLYIGLGDGGLAGDPLGHGQNRKSLLAKILRIDIDKASEGKLYSIPADNPFVNDKRFAGEIYAWGLRNPWRFCFVPSHPGLIICADVGQNKQEEVDLIRSGDNLGWNEREGKLVFRKGKNIKEKMLDPVFVYGRKKGVSITGGFLWQGHYYCADFATGRLWQLTFDAQWSQQVKILELNKLKGNPSSFAQDSKDNMYWLDFSSGRIWKFIAEKKSK